MEISWTDHVRNEEVLESWRKEIAFIQQKEERLTG
jgi:hypothetical protein